jgi:hypothetical protein
MQLYRMSGQSRESAIHLSHEKNFAIPAATVPDKAEHPANHFMPKERSQVVNRH